MPVSVLRTLDALTSRLPFHVDEFREVNRTYTRWCRSPNERDREVIDLWTYCFIRRYFLVKLLQDDSYTHTDADELIDRTFRKIERHSGQINQPGRYASWVSVVCKNTFLNYLRGRKRMVSLEDSSGPALVAETPRAYNDLGFARQGLLAAIERLPAYLRPCARMHFISGLTYEEISESTGYPLPRIRSYVNKAVKRFRKDDQLLAYFDRSP